MDKQVAGVASAKLEGLYEGLLNELLQYVDFQKLLYLRRICWRWHTVITSELVSYLPYVVFAMDLDSHRDDDDNQLWKLVDDIVVLVELPHTLLMFGCNKTIPPHQRLIETFWNYYDSKLDIYGRNSCPIQKVIYANTTVNSEAFCCDLVCQAGFQTVLYHCTLAFSS
ncbi:hypothetical protein RvY_02783-2 [Ramazzottius varieornatus]|uniref:F-box domain-containing protein n=1 Tax=Ramazzottius varieornatus TaxID=947166 RepID=A0A1D1UW28_RAMVA|nr:hypothetical protein RvY_02783-2 [Ramazzottius varieornatus]